MERAKFPDRRKGVKLGLLFLAANLSAQDKETMLGDQLASEIRRQSKPVEDEIQQYVRQVAARVASGSNPVVETIVREDDDSFVVWAPGHLFVPVRVLVRARTEAELAGLLAHGMSHRTQRVGEILTAFAEGSNPAEETRADREAVAKMTAAGYNPYALLDYVERTPYPDPRRVAGLKAATATIAQRSEWIENTSAFVDAQARSRAYEAPKLPRTRPSLRGKNR